MIQVILQGGLGNQMFEYATVLALSRMQNAPFVLDMSYMDVFANKPWCRPYELSVFALHSRTSFARRHKIAVRFLNRLRLFCRARSKTRLGRYFFDVSDPLITCRKSLIIFDYCASYHLFEPYREELLRDFTFTDQPDADNQALLAEIRQTNSVSVHIRRGDYLNSANSNVFFHPTVDWYQSAMKEISKRVKQPHFYFFSDDLDWVKEQFAAVQSATFVDVNQHKGAHNDMRLMAACRHNIIANSTFSWWAAWLNTSPDKMVIAPAKYYKDEHANEKYRRNLIPSQWIQL